ncbi:sensor histidine kinase [Rummeliibacillus suwonensis]|uniref:sensor histidine kinase n=2 Tax=Rummeliibacillus suwonensis TaxID=1306154 RepID=UPI001AAE9566|nr:HAMP domain-containing sensor histidine kinase [Rummeliibacillus suwonensis]MBO2535981.1 HAMP domain-containing histidine kinase [Rummeliibacillus suwonensis]
MHYVELIYKKDLFYLYPISSPTQAYFFITEVLLSIIVSISSFMSISKVQSRTIKRFMAAFFVYSTVLILCGTVNLIPNLGSLVTSIFVIIFSIGLMLSFFRLHLEQNEQFRVLMEREKKMDYIGSLSSSLIHEIRNPLHIIKNFSIVLEKNEKLSENGVEYLKYINSATKQLENIVGNFTDYMKNKKPELEKVDLNEIIDHAIYLTNENTKENRVNVIFEKKYEKLKILANPISFTQVLVNIIKNCAESIPEERQQRLISIDTMYSKGLVYIHIKDTGKGIPQEEWDKIFNPFVSDKEKGMGIGLAFSRKIMYEHSGDLKVLNSTPEGTEFQITIPQHNVW